MFNLIFTVMKINKIYPPRYKFIKYFLICLLYVEYVTKSRKWIKL